MFFRFILFVWLAFILLLTTVSDPIGLMNQYTISFQFLADPDFSQLLDVPEILTKGYINQKVGHFAAFFILGIIAILQMRANQAAVLCFGFAALTEFLQLYAGRSGRLLDIGYDSAGLLSAFLLTVILSKKTLRHSIPAKPHKI